MQLISCVQQSLNLEARNLLSFCRIESPPSAIMCDYVSASVDPAQIVILVKKTCPLPTLVQEVSPQDTKLAGVSTQWKYRRIFANICLSAVPFTLWSTSEIQRRHLRLLRRGLWFKKSKITFWSCFKEISSWKWVGLCKCPSWAKLSSFLTVR